MCASEDPKQVSRQELMQFLFAVAELKGDDSSSASLIIQTIMELDQSEKDHKITEKDFIAKYVLSSESFFE